MLYKHLISDLEAKKQYQQLVESIKVDNYREKAAMLRTQFDTLLHICVEAKLQRRLTIEDKSGFRVFIDLLFPDSDPHVADLRKGLLTLSRLFNKLSAHTYTQYMRQQSGQRVHEYGLHEYEYSLDVLAQFINFVSGTPLPPQVIGAKKQLEKIIVNNENRLDIILMVELFTTISEYQEGGAILRDFQEMLTMKGNLGLSNVHFRLVTYCQPSCNMDLVAGKINTWTGTTASSLPFNEALTQSLNHLYDIRDLQEVYKTERPWLVLLCRGIPDTADVALIHEVKELYSQKIIDFMPMALNQEVMNQFNKAWPHCHPTRLSASLSSNFFKELLASIQRVLQPKQDNKND